MLLRVVLIVAGLYFAAHSATAQRRPIIDVNTHLATNLVRQNMMRGEEPPATVTDPVLRTTLQLMDQFNVRMLVPHSDFVNLLEHWRAKAPDRFVTSVGLTIRGPGRTNWPSLETVRTLLREHKVAAIGEIYISPKLPEDDPMLDRYLALAEEFDVPASFHLTGMINPLLPDKPTYAQSQPTVLQGIMARHPRLRVQIGHGGYPWLSETKAVLRTALMRGNPAPGPDLSREVYADVSMINWNLNVDEFRDYLQNLVRAGFGRQLMFGSYIGGDAERDLNFMSRGIEAIERASFLTEAQKSDIFCGNAARFFKLDSKICTGRSSNGKSVRLTFRKTLYFMPQALVKLQRKGQMVIPRSLREAMGVTEGTLMKVAVVEGHQLLVTPQLTIDRAIVEGPRKNRKAVLRDLAAAVRELRQDAKAKGIDKMPMSEINRAVAAARRDLKKSGKRTRA